ncbi:hypothetical protein ACO2Q9_19095 [Variovorax sp. VNK109]|uniref:hypothetical protein n=1 Tax=Variovorax sp. VNK109 TaxID=3400919 RepID=UPI003C100E02
MCNRYETTRRERLDSIFPGYAYIGGDYPQRIGPRRGRLLNDPERKYGTMVYWLDMFVRHCDERVKSTSTVKGFKMAQRTRDDYAGAIGTDDKDTPLRIYFGKGLTPTQVTAAMVQKFLDINAQAGRTRRANIERATLSACFGWLLRTGSVPGLQLNPCLKGAGVKRNPGSGT